MNTWGRQQHQETLDGEEVDLDVPVRHAEPLANGLLDSFPRDVEHGSSQTLTAMTPQAW
jgi:hypothetical protein